MATAVSLCLSQWLNRSWTQTPWDSNPSTLCVESVCVLENVFKSQAFALQRVFLYFLSICTWPHVRPKISGWLGSCWLAYSLTHSHSFPELQGYVDAYQVPYVYSILSIFLLNIWLVCHSIAWPNQGCTVFAKDLVVCLE